MTKVTVVTLYDDSLVEHYVAVVQGTVDEQGRRDLAEQLDARLPEDLDAEGSDYDDERVLYFREVQTCEKWTVMVHIGTHGKPHVSVLIVKLIFGTLKAVRHSVE